jgi:hypothetical protein
MKTVLSSMAFEVLKTDSSLDSVFAHCEIETAPMSRASGLSDPEYRMAAQTFGFGDVTASRIDESFRPCLDGKSQSLSTIAQTS